MRVIIEDGKLFDGDLGQFEDKFWELPHEFTIEQCLEMIETWCKQLGYSFRVEYPGMSLQ